MENDAAEGVRATAKTALNNWENDIEAAMAPYEKYRNCCFSY